jgi:site-specific DNA-methyltransferase (adenine-specific)
MWYYTTMNKIITPYYQLHLSECEEILSKRKPLSIDLIVTDIPYGINYKSNKQNQDTRSGKTIKIDRDEYFTEINNDDEIPIEWLNDAYRILKDNSAMYIFIHWSKWGELKLAVEGVGFKVKNMIVMNKSNHGMGDLKGDYAPKHELVMFATKGRHILNRVDGRKKNVIDVPVKFSGAKRLHPNEKPLSWAETFIQESSKERDIVLDPFMGSGFVGKASLKHSRRFIGIDNDPVHFQTALDTIVIGETHGQEK